MNWYCKAQEMSQSKPNLEVGDAILVPKGSLVCYFGNFYKLRLPLETHVSGGGVLEGGLVFSDPKYDQWRGKYVVEFSDDRPGKNCIAMTLAESVVKLEDPA